MGDREIGRSPIDIADHSLSRSPLDIADHPITRSPMFARLRTASLLDISDKLDAGIRLTLEEGVRLFDCPDLLAVGWLANREREKRHGPRTFYNYNIRLEATNVCVASCLFCSFARLKPGDAEIGRA